MQSQPRDMKDVIPIALAKHLFPAPDLIRESAMSSNSGQRLSVAVEDSSLLALLLSRAKCLQKETFVKLEGMRKGERRRRSRQGRSRTIIKRCRRLVQELSFADWEGCVWIIWVVGLNDLVPVSV